MDGDTRTLILYAVSNEPVNYELISVLLKYNPDLSLVDKNGHDFAFYAKENKDLRQFLIRLGVTGLE
jgi:hypothetical protein